jgi:hypothetical protein
MARSDLLSSGVGITKRKFFLAPRDHIAASGVPNALKGEYRQDADLKGLAVRGLFFMAGAELLLPTI